MVKKILFFVIILVLLTGCGEPKTIKPGETAEISKTQEFYFGVLVEANSPDYPSSMQQQLQQDLQGKTKQEKIDFLVLSSGKYRVLPDEVKAALLADTVWITPAGVTVENPSVTLEPTSITWTEDMGEGEATNNTVDGYNLIIRADIVASSNAESGEVILKMPQFKTLELANLYVVEIDRVILDTNDHQHVVPDSDTYVVAVVK
jgi:hypothetical protein